MGQVCRDFTVTIGVPDGIGPEDCEIIATVTASYSLSGTSVPVPDRDVRVVAEEPYLCE